MLPTHRQIELDALIDEIIAAYDVVGMALAVVDGKETLYRRVWGVADRDKQSPLDADTIFGLASITKSFTALATMQLVERGILDLDAPISLYLPEFRYPGRGVVKLRHLLSHCAGYAPLPRILASDLFREIGIPENEPQDPALSPSFAAEAGHRVLQRLSDPPYPLLGRPGEILSYCNDGFAALSEVIRLHGGYPTYAEYVAAEILRPLGMDRSRYDALSLEGESNKTALYFDVEEGRRSTDDWHLNGFALMGGGSLKSTLSDMERYLRFYLNHGLTDQGNALLDPFQIAEMQKPRLRHSHLRYYGYGLMTTTMDDITLCGHGGSLPGVSSDMLWSHELNRGVILLCNTSNVPVARITTAVMKALNGHSASEPRIPYQDRDWDEATCRAAVGSYRSGEGGHFVIALDENGKPQFRIGKDSYPVRMVLPDLGLVPIKLNHAELRLFARPSGEIWAIGYGGRVVLRADDEAVLHRTS